MEFAKITTKYNLCDIFNHLDRYINEYSNMEILTVPDFTVKGGLLRFLIALEDGEYFIIVEDDYASDDIYPEKNETLMQTFVRALNDNLMRE